MTMGDHILGADTTNRPDWKPYMGQPPLYDVHTPWHEPLVLFGYMAAITKTLEFSTGIMVGPQRQSAASCPVLALERAWPEWGSPLDRSRHL